MWFLLALPAAAMAAWSLTGKKKDRGTGDAAAENAPTTIENIPMGHGWDDLQALAAESEGWPYFWGKGAPSTPWSDGSKGVDCAGYVNMMLVEAGYLSASEPDRGVTDLANICDPIAVGDQEPGDMAIYNGAGHVVIVIGPPGADGHSPVASASGKGAEDVGQNPNSHVKLFSTALYWDAFNTYMRLKPEHRLS